MANSNDKVLSNPGEPLPMLSMPSPTDDEPRSFTEKDAKKGKRETLKEQAAKVKEKFDTYSTPEGRQSLQDRVFSSIIQQLIPNPGEIPDDEDENGDGDDKGKKGGVKRPQLSPRLFAYNFRRFNARIGVLFLAQNYIEGLVLWQQPTQTLSIMAVYSLLCLKPHLLPVLPLVLALYVAMVPAFIARHPTPANDPRVEPSYHGPATAPPSRVRPAPELSIDFWRNMRDLQNFLGDFSTIHDLGNQYITPYTNFSDEPLSSELFLGVFILSGLLFLGCSPLVPWRFLALAGGWILISLGHPTAQKFLLEAWNISNIQQHLELLQSMFYKWVAADIVMDEPPEVRQVEIFEIQKHHADSDTWESWLFSASPYDPLSRSRVAGGRPKGTQFFTDVQAPSGWMWKEKKWSLDLRSREWVEERMITGVEVEMEGERWVYDIPQEKVEEIASFSSPSGKWKKGVAKGNVPKSGWEEGSGLDKRGEWRRRRWTRVVVKRDADKSASV